MTSLQWGPVHLEPGRSSLITRASSRCPVSLQWGPVHLEPGSGRNMTGDPEDDPLQWGPVHLEPGSRTAVGLGDWGGQYRGFNGARFIWNREDLQVAVVADRPRLRASMGPGSFGTGKPSSPDAGPIPSWSGASMGPGSFGTGKLVFVDQLKHGSRMLLQWGPVHLEPGRVLRPEFLLDADRLAASMGPGSFGTGKPVWPDPDPSAVLQLQWGPVHLEPGSPDACRWGTWALARFNGARFIWNREALYTEDTIRFQGVSFNGARFIWNREGTVLVIPSRLRHLLGLQWGPVHLEPGRHRDSVPSGRLQPRVDASMGPGSFGTGKVLDSEMPVPPTSDLLQWGPVHLEPGSLLEQPGQDENDKGVASMGPGSFGTGKSKTWGPALPSTPGASMGPGSFGTGKPGGVDPWHEPRYPRLQWGPVHLEPGSVAHQVNRHQRNGDVLQWGPVHLEPGSPGPDGTGASLRTCSLQWGPVHLEPGRVRGACGRNYSRFSRLWRVPG